MCIGAWFQTSRCNPSTSRVSVQLTTVGAKIFREVLTTAWRGVAPKRAIEAYEAGAA